MAEATEQEIRDILSYNEGFCVGRTKGMLIGVRLALREVKYPGASIEGVKDVLNREIDYLESALQQKK